MELKIVDTHLHIWDIAKLTYPWLTNEPDINRTFDLETFQRHTKGLTNQGNKQETHLIDKMVFIQCECLPTQYLDEVNYITNLAKVDNRLQGIIPWFPLENEQAEEYIQELIQNPLIKGIRRLEETPISLFKNRTFIKNLDLLSKHHLSFDICAKNNLLGSAITMIEQQPDIKYMLDHMGKPDIKNKETNSWKHHIRLLSENPNVYCKVSGLVTEADIRNWHVDQLRPYFDYALEQFGIDRMVFGGDWPVLTPAASYQQWVDTVMVLCHGLSTEDIYKLFNANAIRFYKLNSISTPP